MQAQAEYKKVGFYYMKRKNLFWGLGLLAGFLLWTLLVSYVDVQPIGPLGSRVGFAWINRFVHDLTGVHWWLYTLTDWLSLIPLGFAAGFGLQGLAQWITRKHLRLVDRSLWLLGGFYGVVLGVFLLFETLVINYRPVLVEGVLEASYPSSTTMLVLCVMLTARMHIRHTAPKWCNHLIGIFTVCMVIGRLVSGVHWITDIIGGILLSGGLVKIYGFVLDAVAGASPRPTFVVEN